MYDPVASISAIDMRKIVELLGHLTPLKFVPFYEGDDVLTIENSLENEKHLKFLEKEKIIQLNRQLEITAINYAKLQDSYHKNLANPPRKRIKFSQYGLFFHPDGHKNLLNQYLDYYDDLLHGILKEEQPVYEIVIKHLGMAVLINLSKKKDITVYAIGANFPKTNIQEIQLDELTFSLSYCEKIQGLIIQNLDKNYCILLDLGCNHPLAIESKIEESLIEKKKEYLDSQEWGHALLTDTLTELEKNTSIHEDMVPFFVAKYLNPVKEALKKNREELSGKTYPCEGKTRKLISSSPLSLAFYPILKGERYTVFCEEKIVAKRLLENQSLTHKP